MTEWNKLATYDVLAETAKALAGRGIDVRIVDSFEEARRVFFQLVPEGSEVLCANSISLSQTGITDQLNKGKYVNIRAKIDTIKDENERTLERRRIKNPKFGAGSVHAITRAGEIVVASSSGSQLGFYAYNAEKLILVVGTQKIVDDMKEAMERINNYTFPLVREDTHNVYELERGVAVNKVLIIEHESTPDRITLIFVKKNLGF